MDITFFGSSITSAYWNGAATYYRGICRSLHCLGHRVTFVEQDIYDRQQHRDLEQDPEYARVVICQDLADLDRELERAAASDLVVKCSGVGRHDDYLDAGVLGARTQGNLVAYWDVDAPFTLEKARHQLDWQFRQLIPKYDVVFTYGGGPRVEAGYRDLGARAVELVYNALDPTTHFPVPSDPEYWCDMLFVGNRLPDRESRVREYFFDAAELCPAYSFILGGEGWGDVQLPSNVRYIGHVPTSMHNKLNCSARLVLNVTRQAMADYGYSPPTRVFEAAGAGACLLTDGCEGIGQFLEPDSEVLLACSAEEVGRHIRLVDDEHARRIGERALERVLRDHTYEKRGAQLQRFFDRAFSYS